MNFSQGTYMRMIGLLFLIIAFGSCFSFGYSWNSLNPGEKAVRFSFMLMYFMGFWFFYNAGKQMESTSFDLPTKEETDKIIKDFESSSVITPKRKPKVKLK